MANIDEGEEATATSNMKAKEQPLKKGAKVKKLPKNVFDFAADDSINNNDSSIDSNDDGGTSGSGRPLSFSPPMEKRCWKCQEMVTIDRQWQHAFANHSDTPAFACRYCDYRNSENRAAVEEHCRRQHANEELLIIDNVATNQALIKKCFPDEEEDELEEEEDKEEEEEEKDDGSKDEEGENDKGEEEQQTLPEKRLPSTSGHRRRVAKKSFPPSKENSRPQKGETSNSGKNGGSSSNATTPPATTIITTPLPKRITCPVDGCGANYAIGHSVRIIIDHFLNKHVPATMGIQKSFFQCSAVSCSFENRRRDAVVAHIRKVHHNDSAVHPIDTRHRFSAAVLAAIGQAHPDLVKRCAEYLKRAEGIEDEEGDEEEKMADDAAIGAIIQLDNEEEDKGDDDKEEKKEKQPKATRAQLLHQRRLMASGGGGEGAISSPLPHTPSAAMCTICQKVINRQHWTRHAFSHHSPVPAYACPHCTFTDNNSIIAVKKHVQQAHGDHRLTIINNVEAQPGVVARCFGGDKNAIDTTTSNTATKPQATRKKELLHSSVPFTASPPTVAVERSDLRVSAQSSSGSDDRRPSIASSSTASSNTSSKGASQQCQRCLVVVQATPAAQIAHYFLRHAKVKRYMCPSCPDFEHDDALTVKKHVEAKHKDLNRPDQQWTDRATRAEHKMAIRQLFRTPTTSPIKLKPEEKKRQRTSNESAHGTNSSSNSPDIPQASPTGPPPSTNPPNPMASMWPPMMFAGGGSGGSGAMPMFMQGMQTMGGGLGPGMQQQQIPASGSGGGGGNNSGSGMVPIMMVPMPMAAAFMQQMMMAAQVGMGAPGGATGNNNNSGGGGGQGQGGGEGGPPLKRHRQQ